MMQDVSYMYDRTRKIKDKAQKLVEHNELLSNACIAPFRKVHTQCMCLYCLSYEISKIEIVIWKFQQRLKREDVVIDLFVRLVLFKRIGW